MVHFLQIDPNLRFLITSWQSTLPRELLKSTISVASTITPDSSRIMAEHCKDIININLDLEPT